MFHHISLRCISVFHAVCLHCYSLFNSDQSLPAIQSFTFLGLKVITTLICCPLLCMSECICSWLKCLLCSYRAIMCMYSFKCDLKWNKEFIFISSVRNLLAKVHFIKTLKQNFKCRDFLLSGWPWSVDWSPDKPAILETPHWGKCDLCTFDIDVIFLVMHDIADADTDTDTRYYCLWYRQ